MTSKTPTTDAPHPDGLASAVPDDPPAPTWRDAEGLLARILAAVWWASVNTAAYVRGCAAAPGQHAATLCVGLLLGVSVFAVRGCTASANNDGPARIPDAAVAATAEAQHAALVADAAARPAVVRAEGAWEAGLPAGVTRWAREIEAAASDHGIAPRLLGCLVVAESGGDPLAQSNFTYQGRIEHAYGLTQVAFVYHPDYDIERGKTDPAYNLDYGAAFLASLIKDQGGDIGAALNAYNGAGYANGYVAQIQRCTG